MSGNSILNNAKYSADTDEWYTTYETIAEELVHYEEQFRNKVVLCNCDDPFESNFAYYFMRNFNKLELKKLICTSYSKSRIGAIKEPAKLSLSLIDDTGSPVDGNFGYVLIITDITGPKGEIVSDDVIAETLKKRGTVKKLNGNGDFRTEECVEYLKQCDICCTNPPFSLFATLNHSQ